MTPMKRITYRPRFFPSSTYFDNFLEGVPPIRVDWRSGGYFGIATNDRAEAVAWVRQARQLGLKVTNAPGDDDPT
jgi:hypothetical protein